MSRPAPMSLWRLERLRVLRTRRWVALLAVYLFFGLLGPFTARYLAEILARSGAKVPVELPPPVPADGLASFVSNASQIGLLVVVIVAASALTLDARPGLSVFYRTRVRRHADLVLPRFVTTAVAAVAGWSAGTLAATYETVVLIGSPGVTAVLLGWLLGSLYLVFAVALAAVVAGRSRSVLATVGMTLGVLLALPILGLYRPVGRVLPSALVGSMDALARGTNHPGDYLGAAGLTVLLTAGLVAAAVRLTGRRDL